MPLVDQVKYCLSTGALSVRPSLLFEFSLSLGVQYNVQCILDDNSSKERNITNSGRKVQEKNTA